MMCVKVLVEGLGAWVIGHVLEMGMPSTPITPSTMVLSLSLTHSVSL